MNGEVGKKLKAERSLFKKEKNVAILGDKPWTVFPSQA
jgi:hypothetical protein